LTSRSRSPRLASGIIDATESTRRQSDHSDNEGRVNRPRGGVQTFTPQAAFPNHALRYGVTSDSADSTTFWNRLLGKLADLKRLIASSADE